MGHHYSKKSQADKILMWVMFAVFVIYAISLLFRFSGAL